MPSRPAHLQGLPTLDDHEFLYGGYSGEEAGTLHTQAIQTVEEAWATGSEGDTRYFILGSYDSPDGERDGPKDRLFDVKDVVNDRSYSARAFLLDELQRGREWANFYLKFRYALTAADYVLFVAEHNDGGHELELGEVPLAETYILKRSYDGATIEEDLEYEKYDAMMATLFETMDANDQYQVWHTPGQLRDAVEMIVSARS